MTDYARLHGWVHGLVQGVGFRYFAQARAHRYGLTGWVRNLPDDRVEFVVEGPRGLLEEFLKDMHRGPAAAHVTKVDVEWDKFTGEFRDFRVRL